MIAPKAFDNVVLLGDFALGKLRNRLLCSRLVDTASPGPDFEVDARNLPLTLDDKQVRHFPFQSGVKALTQSDWAGWPMLGLALPCGAYSSWLGRTNTPGLGIQSGSMNVVWSRGMRECKTMTWR